MDSKKIIFFFLGVVWSEVTDQNTTENCDVISAVKCFSNMAEVPKPHMLTDNPEAEILKPCKEQVNKNSALRSCLESFLGSCNSILVDANQLINVSEAFCSNCLACPNFAMDYTTGLNCTLEIFKTLVNPGRKSKQENCRAYSNCLIETVERCPALRALSLQIWMFFETTCQRVNVSSPSQLSLDEPYPSLICAELDVITMSLSDCYITFLKAVGPKENIVVTSYCKAVASYDVCVDTVLAPCPLFNKIFKNSITSYHLALKSFCGNMTETSSVCDLQGLSICFENVDARLWKSEKYIIEGMGATVDYQKWSENVMQITEAVKTFSVICSEVPDKINHTTNCLSSYLSGCPTSLNEAYHMHTDYLQQLCAQTSGCHNTTLGTYITQCGDTAESQLVSASKNESTTYCEIFQILLTCLDTQFKECAEPSENIIAFYAMIVDDLSPVCKEEAFKQLRNVTFSSHMLNFLGCRHMPVISYEIGECTKTYLHGIARNQTNQEEICKALNNWEECTSEATSDCTVLHTHILRIVEKTRDHLHPICPRPTTEPTQSPEVSEDGKTTIPTNATSTAAVQFSCQRCWTLCLILLMQNWMW